MADLRSISICQSCVYRTHPVMLTGYCLKGLRCDLCGNVADLAMVKLRKPGEPAEPYLTAEIMNARLENK